MKANISIIGALILALLVPVNAAAKNKKKAPRGIIESMQSVPCGVKEKGLSGIGALWGSIGVTSVSSNEKLCPQYLFRTDDLEYHIRQTDGKHPVILPIGQEAEFKIKKDKLFLKVPEGRDHKTRAYHVVAMEQTRASSPEENTSYRPAASQAPANSTSGRPVSTPAQNGSPAQRTANQNPLSPPTTQNTPPQH